MTANAIRAGLAYVEVGIKDKIQAGLNRINQNLKSFGAKLTQFGAGLAGVGLAAGAAFVPIVRAAANAEAAIGKFNTVFGASAASVRQWGNNLADEIGRGQTQVAQFAAGFQDLFVPLGFDPSEAEDLSKQLTRLAFDLASFNDLADADAVRDLQAALTGSGEVMKKYGVLVSEAAVKQRLLNDGFDPRFATDQQKVLARLNIILDSTTAAQGDAARTAGEFNNRMKALEGQLTNAAEAIGAALLPTLADIIGRVNKIIRKFTEWVVENHNLVRVVAATVAGVTALGVAITALGVAFLGLAAAASAVGSVVTFFSFISGISPVVLGVTAAVAAMGVAIGAAVVYFTDWNAAIGTVQAGLSRLIEMFAPFADDIMRAFRDNDFEAAFKLIGEGVQLAFRLAAIEIKRIWLNVGQFMVRVMAQAAAQAAVALVKPFRHLFEDNSILANAFDDLVAAATMGFSEIEASTKAAEALNEERAQAHRLNAISIANANRETIAEESRKKAAEERNVAQLEALKEDESQEGNPFAAALGKSREELEEAGKDAARDSEEAIVAAQDRISSQTRGQFGDQSNLVDALSRQEEEEQRRMQARGVAGTFSGRVSQQIFGGARNSTDRKLDQQTTELKEQTSLLRAIEEARSVFT